ncbi:MAG TPA: CmcI family methyltransferase [Solirubrobacteraceae bacterium]
MDASLVDLWRARGDQSQGDTYAGVGLAKLPEDLRAYEHILWSRRVSVVVEIGVWAGGSSLWFRDRLRALAGYGRIGEPRVIGIDIDIGVAQANLEAADAEYAASITLVEGDVLDPELSERIARLVPRGASCLVLDDSAHTYETTTAALRGYSDLIRPGGVFVVEDGGVDVEEIRLDRPWPRGVIPAIYDWLATDQGQSFRVRRDLELYGLTSHPHGFLERALGGGGAPGGAGALGDAGALGGAGAPGGDDR